MKSLIYTFASPVRWAKEKTLNAALIVLLSIIKKMDNFDKQLEQIKDARKILESNEYVSDETLDEIDSTLIFTYKSLLRQPLLLLLLLMVYHRLAIAFCDLGIFIVDNMKARKHPFIVWTLCWFVMPRFSFQILKLRSERLLMEFDTASITSLLLALVCMYWLLGV